MAKPSIKSFLAAILIIGLAACAVTSKESGDMTARMRIADAYGFQYFGQIEKIQYTFNVKKDDRHIRRFWIWEPKLDRVTFDGMNYQETVTYLRQDPEVGRSSKLKKIDAWFVNDNYWLLFPYHIARDTQITVKDIGQQKLPLGKGTASCLVVTFSADGGYTPGDIYELFLDENFRLKQWVYRRGGSEKPTRITTWETHRQVGPLTVSLNHRGENDNFRVWFTNVGVKMAGIKGWMFAN